MITLQQLRKNMESASISYVLSVKFAEVGPSTEIFENPNEDLVYRYQSGMFG